MTDEAAIATGSHAIGLALRGVTKRFGDQLAVDSLDLDIDPGRVVALIGPSGCGKSTVLRLFNGLVTPDAGEVQIGGDRLQPGSLAAFRARMGYVIQDGGLFPHLSARDNVGLMARYLGWESARIAARIDELVRLVRLDGGLLDRFPRELSGGQAQRIAIMRALVLEPAVLLLDEPMAALDPMIRSALQDDLAEIFATLETTVVLVSHDLAEAAHLGHELVLLREGRIQQRGPANALVDDPANDFVSAFVAAQRGVRLESGS